MRACIEHSRQICAVVRRRVMRLYTRGFRRQSEKLQVILMKLTSPRGTPAQSRQLQSAPERRRQERERRRPPAPPARLQYRETAPPTSPKHLISFKWQCELRFSVIHSCHCFRTAPPPHTCICAVRHLQGRRRPGRRARGRSPAACWRASTALPPWRRRRVARPPRQRPRLFLQGGSTDIRR